ncbi:hypothetical protein NDI76_15550 [Halogeometricum sp. S1BR25-6]|uniref:Uncharacterized protein n=1 Tax=Halogeometricum salsisoli TaxID=2950536 RepID=A0ABU2GH59_9EURY|nr:hypothetical protein [Halogeometricum sp. S1BR25-6]MDS0300161.1 hypothetical protein [Halogeometricum sp. S1BR25-6]
MTRPDDVAVATTRDRGQTNLDFLLGIVVFFLALSFVVASAPQLIAQYDAQETPLVAERASTALADSLLVESGAGAPGTLDVECTGAFFAGSGGTGCPFSTGGELTDIVGVHETYSVNVTLQWDVTGDAELDPLCYNDGDVGACGTDRLAVGPDVPQAHRSAATERRTVLVGDHPAVLEVRVW